ncbi:MAG: hypothetical protein IJ272_04550, partial [Clostridia bacterium]|nr:hypothetical protein [Clostridia bacterium]
MKKESKKRIISLLMCLVMVFGLMPTPVFATTYVDFLTTSNAVEFVITGETGFHRVNLNNSKVDSLPVVYRTDSLDLEFDGWYTAKEGGEKVTTNTEFDSYTILYDRWKASNIDSDKIVDSVEIKVVDPTNGTTALDWYNSCTLSIAADGVQNMSSIALYNCLNAFGTQLNNNDVLDTSKDYSIVALLRLKDGYYFDENISITSYEGVRAGILYQGNGTNTNYWNSIATQALVTINFPAGGSNNVGFTTEPQSGVVNVGNAYNFTWAVDGQPSGAQLQMKDGNAWVKLDDLTINQNGTISDRTGTETFRIVVNYTSGSICSNEFTVTWFDPNANSFSMHPTSGTVNNGTDFYYTWACVHT